MYDLLLEREEQLFFQLVQRLLLENKLSLLQVATDLKTSSGRILQGIHQWQVKGRHLQVGLDIVKDEGKLFLLKNNQFCQRNLFATLVADSVMIELLHQLWQHPSYGISELATAAFHSPQTVRRRLRRIQPLLVSYGLSWDFQKRPMLQGNEAQIRFFYLHLATLLKGNTTAKHPQRLLKIVYQLAEERIHHQYLIKEAWFDRRWIQEVLGLADYVINERSYRFLWQQLLGLEKVWVSGKLEQALQRYFLFEAGLGLYRQELSADLYRLLLLAMLFQGSLTLDFEPRVVITSATKRLERLFHDFLPDYEKLANRHPELSYCYEMLVQKYRQRHVSPLEIYGLS